MKKIYLIFILICSVLLGCKMPVKTEEAGGDNSAKATEVVINRNSYQMKYYSDWKIDSLDVDFDMDSYFTFDTPSGNGTSSIFVFNTSIDEKLYLDNQIEAHLAEIIKNGTVSKFNKWGGYQGHGAIITGKLLGVMKGEIHIFVHSNDSSAFLIVAQMYTSDKEQDLPGLKLIESTFRLKN